MSKGAIRVEVPLVVRDYQMRVGVNGEKVCLPMTGDQTTPEQSLVAPNTRLTRREIEFLEFQRSLPNVEGQFPAEAQLRRGDVARDLDHQFVFHKLVIGREFVCVPSME
jgi:hypothetical protein